VAVMTFIVDHTRAKSRRLISGRQTDNCETNDNRILCTGGRF